MKVTRISVGRVLVCGEGAETKVEGTDFVSDAPSRAQGGAGGVCHI